jgi:hypothetical protein
MAAMQDEFFSDSAFVGIGTAMQGYRLCWMLNNHFGIGFYRDPELNIAVQKKEARHHFPIYQYELPNSYHKYLLYKLKSGSESLLPETRQLDYLWLVQTANYMEDAAYIASELKSIADIQLARVLETDQLKNLNNLLV